MRNKSLELAIERIGGLHAAGRALGISWQAVQRWVKSGMVPPKRVLALEQLSGVARWKLRSDIYPPP